MDLRLKDKVAVVLAASSGIGRGIATVLAQEGCNIAICARDKSRLDLVANEIRSATGVQVFAERADVADAISLDGFFDQILSVYGKVDILVNNSGGPKAGSCFEFDDQDFQSAYELVLMSKIRACRRVIPVMVKQRWGRIINVESTSVKSALENMVLSNTFRSASTAFAKTLSMEYGKAGIRVHTLLSGPFHTNRMRELGTTAAKRIGITFDQWRAAAEKESPLGRFGDPLEFGGLVAFLCSDVSGFMNGTTIVIDGGELKNIN